MQLVSALLESTLCDALASFVQARNCTNILKGQAAAGTAKDLARKLAQQRRFEPGLVRVLLTSILCHLADSHHTIELGTILGVELTLLSGASQAPNIHTILHSSDGAAALSILHEGIVVSDLECAGLLLSLEGDLDHRTVFLHGEDAHMAWGWLVVKGWTLWILAVVSPADIFLVLRPAIACWLVSPAAIHGEMRGRLLSPRVFVMAIVHAVHVVIIRLDAHGSSTILNPVGALSSPTVAPILRNTFNQDFIPLQLVSDILGQVVTTRCKLSQVVDVLI